MPEKGRDCKKLENENSNRQAPEKSPAQPAAAGGNSNKQVLIVFGILTVLFIVVLTAFYIFPNNGSEPADENINKEAEQDNITEPEKDEPAKEEVFKPSVEFSSKFAPYKEVAVDISPKIPVYAVNQDLSNVTNAADYPHLSKDRQKLLAKNSFLVEQSFYREFFPLYESNRYSFTPNFITTDSMLHNYHLMFDHLLKQLEEQKLAAELKKLNAAMLAESLSQYNALKGTEWENAARRNVGFFAVAGKFMDPSTNVPGMVAGEVKQELALAEAHEGIKESPVMNIGNGAKDDVIDTPQGLLPLGGAKEDYSQYIPRGHYDRTDQLKAYFKSMMWYGRMTFRLKSQDETRSAVLITLALNKGANRSNWNNLYEPINFFVGKTDDINYYQFNDLVEKIYGTGTDIKTVSANKEKFASFVNEAKKLDPPQINSMPVFQASIQADREEEIKGFRFMGQRFTIDASIFQRLIYREVGDKTKTCGAFKPEDTGCMSGARCLPKGLDIPAAMGSGEALNILKGMDETKYACYSENMSKMNAYLSGLKTDVWAQNLYWGWMYQLRPLLSEKKQGYPAFMQNSAWLRKDLNTFLGSWTELKHDTILYAKQVYAELGAGGAPDERDDRGYVEPNVEVYARLASLLKMTSEGLESRGLLTPAMKENLAKMEQLAMSLKTISEKELKNEKPTDEEYELIRSFGGQLEHFWLEVNKDEPAFKKTMNQRDYLDENPAAIVADVATDPNGQVLEEGTGHISDIYVIFPIDGKLRIGRGGVYSYYEFSWPMSDRLTDKKWRDMLESGNAPDLPEWTNAFMAKRSE